MCKQMISTRGPQPDASGILDKISYAGGIRSGQSIAAGAMCHVKLGSLNEITVPSTLCLLLCKNAYFAVLAVERPKSFRAVFDIIYPLYHGPFSPSPKRPTVSVCLREDSIARPTAHSVMELPVTIVWCFVVWGSAAPLYRAASTWRHVETMWFSTVMS